MPHEAIQASYKELVVWLRIIANFAVVLGIASLVSRHWNKIRRRQPDWQYSIITLLLVSLPCSPWVLEGQGAGTPFAWSFDYVLVRWMRRCSRCWRFSWRRRPTARSGADARGDAAAFGRGDRDAGRVPIGEYITHHMPTITEWLMSVPTVAAKRAIIFGVALGGIATSLRIILH